MLKILFCSPTWKSCGICISLSLFLKSLLASLLSDESDEFIVSARGFLLVRETFCEREDESSNAEESQLDFMSRETAIHIHTNEQTQVKPPQCSRYIQTHEEFDLMSEMMTHFSHF